MRCIVFVERVITAIVLKSLLCKLHPKLFGWKTEYTAGNFSAKLSQSRNAQNKIVDDFRNGMVCLFSVHTIVSVTCCPIFRCRNELFILTTNLN